MFNNAHQVSQVTKAEVWGCEGCTGAQPGSAAQPFPTAQGITTGMISQQCAFSPTKEGALHECGLSFLAGSVSSSIYQMRLSKTKDFTFPSSLNKSHLSNVIISRISTTVNIFFCISVLTFYMTCTWNIITSMAALEHSMTAYLSWRKSSLLPDNG